MNYLKATLLAAPSRLRAHGLAHACVCALVLLSWSVPGALKDRAGGRAPSRLSEAEVDAELQRAAQSALGGREGTILVLDAQTGRVRAAANAREAFEEATPPGSSIKPFTMLTALRAGTLDEETRVFCRGRYEREGFKIACSHPRYKSAFGPVQALANSCNYFFAHTAQSLDGEAYAKTLREFGFGARTRGGDERESAGQLPRDTPGVPEMLGESEEIRVTPAQLATAYAALFNGGRLLVPERADADGFTPRLRSTVEIEPKQRALLLAGMRGAVAYGTAARAGLATLEGVYVFGKTGTSTPQDGWRSQGWFVGFAADKNSDDKNSSSSQHTADEAPPERVRLAVLVFLKRSRGAEAAGLARPVFETYARALARNSTDAGANSSEGDNNAGEGDADADSSGARASNSTDENGVTVRVRLSHEDRTLTLPLGDYVFGVLAAEGSVETEPEALKALAVVVRTYALKNLNRHARDRYDFCDTTHCQRFVPVGDESARPEFYELVRRAVAETSGETLRDPRGGVAETYFSASCGGRTADISKLWGVRDAPAYLRGVRDDFCAGAGDTWTDVIPAPQLLRALRADERSDTGARLDSVRVVRRDETGRAELLELAGERRRLLRGWDFKIIVGRTLGWNVLKSSRFDVSRAGSAFVFRGTGFGHGLGLCQAGAHVMASRGLSYREILKQYFPGTSVGGQPSAARASTSPDADSTASHNSATAQLQPTSAQLQLAPASDAVRLASVARAFAYFAVSSGVSWLSETFIDAGGAEKAQPAREEFFSTYKAGFNSPRLSLSSEHFRVSYPARASRGDVEAALRVLEAARADVSRRLESASVGAGLPVTEVFVYETTGDFVGATGKPAWVAAATAGRRIELQPLEVLKRRGAFATTLRHEFVHAALDALGHGHAPLWLEEGLAILVAGEGPQLARTAPRERISTDELERELENPGSPQRMRALYAAAYAEVSALIRREGEAAAWRRAVQ
jgi:stage II sporulation protein D